VGSGIESDGKITIGDHWETFTASHVVCDRSHYETQWREAADRILDGQPGSFVVDLAGGQPEYRGESWNVWPEGDVAIVQNQRLILSNFDPDEPHAFRSALPQRVTEDGHRMEVCAVASGMGAGVVAGDDDEQVSALALSRHARAIPKGGVEGCVRGGARLDSLP
jgi:hypothetical protein